MTPDQAEQVLSEVVPWCRDAQRYLGRDRTPRPLLDWLDELASIARPQLPAPKRHPLYRPAKPCRDCGHDAKPLRGGRCNACRMRHSRAIGRYRPSVARADAPSR